jgi:hypothetical protein
VKNIVVPEVKNLSSVLLCNFCVWRKGQVNRVEERKPIYALLCVGCESDWWIYLLTFSIVETERICVVTDGRNLALLWEKMKGSRLWLSGKGNLIPFPSLLTNRVGYALGRVNKGPKNNTLLPFAWNWSKLKMAKILDCCEKEYMMWRGWVIDTC